ncbi:hypothetical protein [Nostoc sp. PCC 7107]|uniref:hypothetical protein n=1 Tax=Nostoc sp. PCC 7107 TaxID=317936 RepID=UPI00029F4752|nr:hypothetical protein [Nostoc sp. PCC 7107]AFY44403.1 hypothetical protein Nos7107_3843 [Nostoc sp. PCC 7107]
MTTPVADKTPVPPKIWKRHSDPPSLWIFVTISSVSLHLLIFWLMRSSNVFGLWFPQQSQAIVPIELVEIYPTAKSKLPTTTVSPKPNISSQQNIAGTLPETANNIARNQDSETSILNQKKVVSQKNTKPLVKKPVSQPKPKAQTTPKPSFTTDFTKPTPTPKPTPTIPIGNLPWNRRQGIILGKGKPLPSSLPSEPSTNSTTGADNNPRTPTGNSSPSSTDNTSNTPPQKNPTTSPSPTNKTSPIPTRNTPQTPTDKNPTTSEQAGSTVTIVPFADQEMRQLSKDLPDVLATYQGSGMKTLAANSLNGENGLAPAQLVASFVIAHNGNFQQAIVLEIKPSNLQSEKNLYQQAINELFRNEKFTPAYNQDGSKPDLSNLFVKITIQPVNSN